MLLLDPFVIGLGHRGVQIRRTKMKIYRKIPKFIKRLIVIKGLSIDNDKQLAKELDIPINWVNYVFYPNRTKCSHVKIINTNMDRNRKITSKMKDDVIMYRSKGLSMRRIAAKLGINATSVYYILNPDKLKINRELTRMLVMKRYHSDKEYRDRMCANGKLNYNIQKNISAQEIKELD
jgi:hypothetical protein